MNSTFKEIEKRVNESKKSKKINLDKLSLTTLPGSSTLGKLSSKHIDGIEELVITNNLIQSIDDKSLLTSLNKLERLDLSHNNLSTINDLAFGSDGAPSTLTEINLSHNKLTDFPQFVCSAGLSLTTLILSHNRLTTVSTDLFDRLSTLTHLDLSFNALCFFPPNLATALGSSLRSLSFRGNGLSRIPEGTFAALSALTSLDLSDNRLTRLPADFRELGDHLESLALGGNPWEAPRAAVCEAGRDAVFAELERLAAAKGCALTSRVVDLACTAADALPLKFAVVVCDPQGVPRITGGDDVTAVLSSGASAISSQKVAEGNVTDDGSGVYVVSIGAPVAPGTYRLDVAVNGALLPSSPFTIHIWPESKSGNDENEEEEEEDDEIIKIIKEQKSDDVKKSDIGADDGANINFGEDDDSNGGLLAGAVGACREYNIPVEVPEILICGAPGYEEVVEAVAGVYPVKVPRGCLRRPLVLNFIYSEKVASSTDAAARPEITLMKDPLLGSSVPMGLRDAPIDDPSTLSGHIQRRNSTASATSPVIIQFAGRYSLPHRIVVAPALPSSAASSDDSDTAAASAFIDAKLRTCAAVVCVLPAMEWRLVQTSAWLPRLRAADPGLTRTHFMFTGLAPFIATFHSAPALADFVKGRRAAFRSCCYATLPAERVAAACTTSAEYAAALAALASRDAAALERLWGDRALRSSIGVGGLRRTLASALRAHYREVLPRLQQHIADTLALKSAEAARIAAARKALEDGPGLAATLRAAATERAVLFGQSLTATLKGAPAVAAVVTPLAAEAGTTLEEEIAAVLDTGFPLRGLVLADPAAIPRANARVYGGAQIDRIVAFFRASARRAAQAPPPFPDALAHCSACRNRAAAAVGPACQAARAEARAALVPLINFLADATILAVKRCADVADSMLDRKKMMCENDGFGGNVCIPGLCDYSYLATNVSGIFVELASTAIEQLRDSCVEQVVRAQQGQIPQEDLGVPELMVEGGADEEDEAVEAERLAERIYTRILENEAQTVAARFYGAVLDELTVRVPAETHATIMGFDQERIEGMFKINGLKDSLDDQKAMLEEEIEKCVQKQKEISEIAIN